MGEGFYIKMGIAVQAMPIHEAPVFCINPEV